MHFRWIQPLPVLMLLLSAPLDYCLGQEEDGIDQVIYMIGNTAGATFNKASLASLQSQLRSEVYPYTVLHLGDIVDPEEILNPETAFPDTSRMDLLLELVRGKQHARLYFTPGEMDWNNAGKGGLSMLRELEAQLETRSEFSGIVLPPDGCPGPEVIDLSPRLRLIAINTHWWLHTFDIPEEPDADCNNLNKEEFLESLEEAIGESAGRNILIIGHHPLTSAGVYGGHMTFRDHISPLPLYGSFFAAYRQNVGTVRDMASDKYQEFIDHMGDILARHPGLIYASAHEYSLQLLEYKQAYQVISGSIVESAPTGNKPGALFTSSKPGYARLEYHQNGEIRIGYYEAGMDKALEIYSQLLYRSGCEEEAGSPVPVNRFYIPCLEEDASAADLKIPYPADSARVQGGSYPARGFKKMLLGSLHRDTWQTPLLIPYLNLDTAKSGLTPFALGGGRQTTSLKFRASDGREYAFRSVDKNLVNALPERYRKTFVGSMIKEVTATEYPYGAIIASALMDETDIRHARPKLYVLPDHPGLGVFREPLAGLFGMLEDRPQDPVGELDGFAGADDVTRSAGLFRKLYRDNDYSVDAEALGTARVFDMLIGDWGRHEDNWKWAGYDGEDQRVYYPIPRDRDHAFCRWNGLIPYMADREWAMPMVESFEADFGDIKSLTWPGRYLDRFLLPRLDQEDWKQLASDVQQKMTDEVIDQAIRSLPREIIPVSGMEIGEMLKSRRDQLPEAVDEYYSLLATRVDVVGSNKHESVEVDRLPTGNVQVSMYKRKKDGEVFLEDPLFSREFERNQTKEICIYGLDGEDVFSVKGSTGKSILVRIIGGPGNDEITDSSRVSGPKKYTIIYDTESTSLNLGPESRDLTSDKAGINLYDRTSFKYNTYLPKPLISYSSDDGFVGSFGMNWTRQGFRKEDFKSKYDIYVKAGTVGNIQLGLQTQWKELLGHWDAGLRVDYGHYFPYYNYFGLGNNTVKVPELFDADYYKVYLRGLLSSIYTEKELFKKGLFRLSLLYDRINVQAETDSIFHTEEGSIPGADQLGTGGVNARFYVDFRDRQVFATRGMQFLLENTSYLTLEGASGNFGLAESYVKYYGTAKVLIPVTLVLKLGGSMNYGHQIPFYRYTHLGQFSNLRGYKRNRFTGDLSAYLNSELRFHLGKVRNLFLPFETGLIVFFDAGRVWMEGNSEGGWHPGYGAGLYISPLTRDYLFTLMFESSPEEKLLFRFGFGFMLDN